MTSRISKLVLAAVLTSTIPAVATAHDGDHDRCDQLERYDRGDRREDRVQPVPWREAAWRERELREVRAELQALDTQRAEVHARFARKPGKVRHYDRWYAERRAELERRWSELQRVAWR
ncbi:MAG TPA: hypothetical protein VF912_13450 [Anaeromyxobacter sp.]